MSFSIVKNYKSSFVQTAKTTHRCPKSVSFSNYPNYVQKQTRIQEYSTNSWQPSKSFNKIQTTRHISFGNVFPTTIAKVTKRCMSFVTTEKTPNPESLKFLPHGQEVLGEGKGTMNFPSARSAFSSPLALALFKIEGVKGVFFGSDFITVTKSEDADWSYLKTLIFEKIMNFYGSGEPVVRNIPPPVDTAPQPEDSEVVSMIKELLETRIRPAVQEDGGDIVFKAFTDGVVFLKMQGSCSGCPSSAVTLKSGIERMLTHWIPEVTNVVAVDDDDLEKLNLEQFQKTEQKLNEKEKAS